MKEAKKVIFKNFDNSINPIQASNNLEILKNVPTHLTMVIGEADLTLKDLTTITEGTLIPINRIPSELLVDINTNDGTTIARGEIVVAGGDEVFIRVKYIGKEENTKNS